MGVFAGRHTARLDGDFVVFLIGMRVNRPWKIHKWVPVAMAMGPMVKEALADPSIGLLSVQSVGLVLIQYWRSFEHLERYARAREHRHWPAWTDFNKRVRAASGDVGIWHETYLVKAGQYETIYGAMPRMGLANAGAHITAAEAARERLGSEAKAS